MKKRTWRGEEDTKQNHAGMGKKKEKEPDRVLVPGKPDLERCDNKVVSARYTVYNFLPVVRSSLACGGDDRRILGDVVLPSEARTNDVAFCRKQARKTPCCAVWVRQFIRHVA